MADGDGFSLREVLDIRFNALEAKIDVLAAKVDSLEAQEKRLHELEFTVRALKWVGGVVTSVVLALTGSAETTLPSFV